MTDEAQEGAPKQRKRKLRVAVLFGGQSQEHNVSLASATSVLRALNPEKYDVVEVGITRTGQWLSGGAPLALLKSGEAPGAPNPASPNTGLIQVAAPGALSVSQAGEAFEAVDVVFPVLHGPYGEDGTIQGMLEMAGLPYVGSGVLGSAAAMDKITTKALFIANGLPVGPYIDVARHEWQRDPAVVQARAEAALTYPMFAKPSNLGSSVGVSKIHGPAEFATGVNRAAKYDRRILIEQGIDAREIECGVLGANDPIASVCGEIVPEREFYDYRAKYIDGDSALYIPADLPNEVADEVRRLAVAAFKAVDAAGMSRVDFFVQNSDNKVFINEINTIPGFTAISMYPKLWEASGLAYADLIDRLIELALERFDERHHAPSADEDDEEARTIEGQALDV